MALFSSCGPLPTRREQGHPTAAGPHDATGASDAGRGYPDGVTDRDDDQQLDREYGSPEYGERDDRAYDDVHAGDAYDDEDPAQPDAPLLEQVDPAAEVRGAAQEAAGEAHHGRPDWSTGQEAVRERHGGEYPRRSDAPEPIELPGRSGAKDAAGNFAPASIRVAPPEPVSPTTVTKLPQAEHRPVEPVAMPHGTGLPPYTAILWDLDGTISDSAPGIVAALRKTFDVFRMPIPDDETLLSYVGPPIIDSFKHQHLDDAIEIQHALETYREIHEESGLIESPAFAGIPELIRDAHRAGIPQSTATSKPESAARIVLGHYGLLDEFDEITGATDDESRSKKEDVVAEALRRLEERGVDLSNVIMIGDRFYDVHGSAAHGVPCIYVTWGYGQLGEDEGAVAVATSSAELRKLLGL